MQIVEAHHKVLTAWAEYRAQLACAPKLITLDHHTDTSPAFRSYLRAQDGAGQDLEALRRGLLGRMDFTNPRTIEEALHKLGNDEHIIAALKTDIISSAYVIAHKAMDTDLATFREHKIMCRGVSVQQSDQVLESDFLSAMKDGFNEQLELAHESQLLDGPYILDIDLDYLNSYQSVRPKDATTLKAWVRGAGLVTIATEPEYVRHCSIDKDLTSKYLLSSLLELIR